MPKKSTKSRKKMGRPKLPADQARTVELRIRVSSAEQEAIRRRADQAGQTLSEFARARLLG